MWAPDTASYGYDSRAASIRILSAPGVPLSATRFEVRVPGADVSLWCPSHHFSWSPPLDGCLVREKGSGAIIQSWYTLFLSYRHILRSLQHHPSLSVQARTTPLLLTLWSRPQIPLIRFPHILPPHSLTIDEPPFRILCHLRLRSKRNRKQVQTPLRPH